MSKEPAHAETKEMMHPHDADLAAEAKAKKATDPVSRDLMLLLLVTDWLHGDKHHYDMIRKAAIKLLKDAGADGAEALARLEAPVGLVTPAPAAKAA